MAEASPLARRDSDLKGRRLGRVLTKMGVVTRDQVQEALTLQEKRKAPLGQLLVELGYLTPDQVNAGLAAVTAQKSAKTWNRRLRCWRRKKRSKVCFETPNADTPVKPLVLFAGRRLIAGDLRPRMN